MNKKIIIYTTPTCVYCKMAKEWFNQNKIEFVEYDVLSDAEKRMEMIEKTGQMGVPVIMIGDEIIVGFDRRRIEELIKK